MLRKWLTIALIGLSFHVFGQQDSIEESLQQSASSANYIRDDLFVFLHAGPGRNYRILGSIGAGAPVTVLDTDSEAEFTQVKDNEDRTGWVETRFISDTMSRAEQLPLLTQRLADSEANAQGLQTENTRLKQQLSSTQQELASLKKSTGAQEREIKSLTEQLGAQSKDEMIKWFTWGGIVAGGGVLLGVILTFLPRKRRRNDEWM
ncbi:TIGR04211 family SH3 domain-containing protein [Aestuariibacter sp. A3R04]|uniref:TIGR04211 family SH3 domain-containing protein n=1 Tax=Aestuariibacter sp. A3R04 TaxID=2841571 RepID=UPI001C0A2D72|nr:TIGR04211 family SH3 domain-containing protein [Aestuariibacter sp. A3R04]MBU3021136.1 TIGR04211 family SH3 domain-containing protein [Aestuariibacter sp. A3R04]